jgi:hypothetical protein
MEETADGVSCANKRPEDVNIKTNPSNPRNDAVLIRVIGIILRLCRLYALVSNA